MIPLRRLSGAIGLIFPAITTGLATASTTDAQLCNQPTSQILLLWTTQRRATVTRALRAGFGIQYWGQTFSADQLAAAPHGLLVIETAKVGASAVGKSHEVFFLPEEVRRIRHNGQRPVLGYLNLAKIEHYRDYWVDAFPVTEPPTTPDQGDAPWIGPSLGPDGTLARFWTPDWEAILRDRVDRLMRQGVDGLFLDDALQYYAYHAAVTQGRLGFAGEDGPQSAADFARAMMKLVMAIASQARQHSCGALVIVNSGIFIGRDAGQDVPDTPLPDMFTLYRSTLDGILIESVFAAGGDEAAISVLHDDFASYGVPVLTVDFADADTMPVEEFRTKIGQRAIEEGFAPYIAEDAGFNRLFAPIPADQAFP